MGAVHGSGLGKGYSTLVRCHVGMARGPRYGARGVCQGGLENRTRPDGTERTCARAHLTPYGPEAGPQRDNSPRPIDQKPHTLITLCPALIYA